MRRSKPSIINYQYIHFGYHLRRHIRSGGNRIQISLFTSGKYKGNDIAMDLLGHAVAIILELGIQVCVKKFNINIEAEKTQIYTEQLGNFIDIKVAQVDEKDKFFSIDINGVEYQRKYMNTQPIQYTLQNERRGHHIQIIDPLILQHRSLLYSPFHQLTSRLYRAIKMEKDIHYLIGTVAK